MVRRMPESEIYSEPARGVKIDLKIVVEDCINQLEAQGAPAQDIAQSRQHADALRPACSGRQPSTLVRKIGNPSLSAYLGR